MLLIQSNRCGALNSTVDSTVSLSSGFENGVSLDRPALSCTYYPSAPALTGPNTKYQRLHTGGVAFLAIGAALIVGGTALIIAGSNEVERNKNNPNYNGTPVTGYVLPGAIMGIAGIGLSGTGLFFTLRYRRNGRHSWK